MPTKWLGLRLRVRRCEKRVTWSIRRGGCRFEHGHDGDCKPTPGRH